MADSLYCSLGEASWTHRWLDAGLLDGGLEHRGQQLIACAVLEAASPGLQVQPSQSEWELVRATNSVSGPTSTLVTAVRRALTTTTSSAAEARRS